VPERETIVAAVEPVLTPLGLELFDVQFTGSGRARTVRVAVHAHELLTAHQIELAMPVAYARRRDRELRR